MPWTTDGSGHGIFPFVAAANLAKLAGYDDWRIPNIFEFITLMKVGAPKALPDATAFPGFPEETPFWSSTTAPGFITESLYFVTTYFYSTRQDRATNSFTLLVRGG
jgi:hypothetical protein